jgi:hypothetical protein
MKITRDALEMAVVAAGESKMPLILTGRRSVITDVVIDKSYCKFDTWAVRFPSELPFGIRRYGKVLTKHDTELGPGYNMVVDEKGYRFLDPDGKEVKIEIMEVSPFNDEDFRVLDECELTG